MNDLPNRPPEAVAEQLQDFLPKHCSAVLQYFHQHPTAVVTVDDLVTSVHEQSPPGADESQVAIHLHHATLPKLAEKNLIDYDPKSQTARYQGRPAGGVTE